MNIKLFRMSTGETIISELLSWKNSIVEVKNPCVIIQNEKGVGFMPMVPYANSDVLQLAENHVIFQVEPVTELVNEYNRIFGSGIVLASANDIK